MIFDSKNVYLFQTGNHNSLILNEVNRFFDTDNTILIRFKPNLEKCKENINLGVDHAGSLLAMNGKHIGIFYKLNDSREQVSFEWWEKDDTFKYIEIDYEKPEKPQYFDVILQRSNNKFTLTVNNKSTSLEVGELSEDYTNSLLWLGAATKFSEEHSCPFYGDIEKVHITKEKLNQSEIALFFDDYNEFVEEVSKKEEAKTLFTTSFTKTTYFKIMDESDNGNHPILYKDEWLET